MMKTPYKMSLNGSNNANTSAGSWEGLRKKARSLENELEMKLVSFSKLGTSQQKNYNKTEEKEALLGSNTDRMFETMSMEIERLLSKLTEVNDNMSSFLSDMSIGEANSAQLHTMQRHRDILQDYSHEFSKTKANIQATKEREDLLGSVQRDIYEYKTGANRRTEMYLKEHEHLKNSERAADEIIDMAMVTKENLGSQRRLFNNISGRVISLTNRFPVINSLVQKINVRKRRDTIILGFVISVCLILLILYALH